MELVNSLGTVVMAKTIFNNESKSISIAGASGLYFLTIKNGTKVYRRKILKLKFYEQCFKRRNRFYNYDQF